MSKRPVVRVLIAGAALSIAGCKKGGEPAEPPVTAPVEEVEAIPTANPPPPPPPDSNLPAWDEVASGHPEGATNPPSPFLLVTPDGDCYKGWRGAMMPPRPGEVIGDRVQVCEEGADCGTAIQCPEPRASELLEAHAKGEAPVGKPISPKPEGL
ncbi:MAG: hypothetical protein KC912_11835 [Proteobacteria bacterium]|nr:hypothetical protein [Pseudomonadota bacterium]